MKHAEKTQSARDFTNKQEAKCSALPPAGWLRHWSSHLFLRSSIQNFLFRRQALKQDFGQVFGPVLKVFLNKWKFFKKDRFTQRPHDYGHGEPQNNAPYQQIVFHPCKIRSLQHVVFLRQILSTVPPNSPGVNRNNNWLDLHLTQPHPWHGRNGVYTD